MVLDTRRDLPMLLLDAGLPSVSWLLDALPLFRLAAEATAAFASGDGAPRAVSAGGNGAGACMWGGMGIVGDAGDWVL